MTGIISRISNRLLSVCAGCAAFVLTLLGFLLLRGLDEQLVASLSIGLLALMVVWIASEKPNSSQARAAAALVQRILAVKTGDLHAPAPPLVSQEMPELAHAIEGLFAQVRSNLENVHAMAMYDPVTSLPNRVHFRKEAERMLSARVSNETLALLFVDLDGFKDINDNLGHAAGDRILTLVADRLRTAVRAEWQDGERLHPLIARLAGDEFTLLFPAVDGVEDAERLCRRVLAGLCEPFSLDGRHIGIGASIGVALCPDHGDDLTALMRAADIAMYRAKSSGRSCFHVHDAALAAAFEERSRLGRAMHDAVSGGKLTLALQPQLCARSGVIIGCEALVRWDGADGKPDGIQGLVALSDTSEVAAEIGDWAGNEVAAVLARWHAQGMAQRVSLDVSPGQLRRPDFFRRLSQDMAAAGAPIDRLELEFSETSARRCTREQIQDIALLRVEGLSIVLDEFGAGLSNLSRLRDMPVDRIKLSHGLTSDVDSCPSARTIVSSIVHMAHGLGAQVVADGVERLQQLEVLRAIGCDLVQGELISVPMPEPEFLRWVADRIYPEDQARTA